MCFQDEASPSVTGLYVDNFFQTVSTSDILLFCVFRRNRQGIFVNGPFMAGANKEAVGSKCGSACRTLLIAADNTGKARWELSSLQCIRFAQAMHLDFCLNI